jgi:hypothetical protein
VNHKKPKILFLRKDLINTTVIKGLKRLEHSKRLKGLKDLNALNSHRECQNIGWRSKPYKMVVEIS